MRRHSSPAVVVATAVPLALLVALASGCPPAPPQASARRVATRAELIGGPRALGEVGDWLIENDKVRFIIQDEGFSRGFGVFGGALLDADLVRPEAGRGTSEGGTGRDNFGEMFPAFFLEALAPIAFGPDKPAISVENPGGNGEPAVILVRATGGDFLAITQTLNEFALDDARPPGIPRYEFETRYILKPGAQHLEMETTVRNIAGDVEFPRSILPGVDVPAPFGDVILFGAGNKVFLPHEAGFDLRFRLEKVYQTSDIQLPAFPGLVAEFIASASKDVSYGVMTFPAEGNARNFAFLNKDTFPEATEHSLHVPFIASAFTGVFQGVPCDYTTPESGGTCTFAGNDGQPGGPDEFKVRRALIVGDGDVASVSDIVYALLADKTGTLQGRVQERQRPLFVDGASVIVLDENGVSKVTQARTDRNGRFDAKLRPGTYQLQVVVAGQAPSSPVSVDIVENQIAFEELIVDSPAEVVVTVVEEGVGAGPAKATLVGVSEARFAVAGDGGADTRATKEFLFDLSVGQPFQYTDFVDDEPADARTRRYIEAFGTSADGVIRLRGRPGAYTVVGSRGTEYERAEQTVTLEPGVTKTVQLTIRRGIDSAGYIGADFHLHSQFSLDSSAKVDERIANYAAEGMEYAVSTDHNFIVDYQPVLQKLRLEQYINTAVGLELTTIDRGHFNGFPLDRGAGALMSFDEETQSFVTEKIGSRTYGSFEWALQPPTSIFDELRALGRKNAAGEVQPVIIQVNHPRDSILGYFEQYGVSADDLTPLGIQNDLLTPDEIQHPEFDPALFSFDFDAIEVFNGKRFEFLHSFTVPADAPRVTLANGDEVVVEPVSCCPASAVVVDDGDDSDQGIGDVLRDVAGRECPGGADECGCDADVLQFQLDEGNCDAGSPRVSGDIAFPGVSEDWMMMLETLRIVDGEPSRRIIGTGNSDSHEPEKEEPGYPRTYVRVPVDQPTEVTPEQVVGGFHAGDVVMSNGPFIKVTTHDGKSLGGVSKAANGTVTLNVHIESATWVDLDVLRVYQNRALVHEQALPGAGKHDVVVELDAAADGFALVEVAGSDSMFPVVYPNEIPPLQFTDVIGALGSSFGLTPDPNALKPALLFVTSPYALTNPVWIDADGDGVVTPSRILPGSEEDAAGQARTASTKKVRPPSPGLMKQVDIPWVETAEEAQRAAWLALPVRKRVALARLPRWLWPSDQPQDVRRALLQFVGHADP